ncbi:hypothetical protein M422DRAFT_187351, partial [Sphaerobolus stellatus SS14]
MHNAEKITGKKNAAMTWENYETKIRLNEGVELVGWPENIPMNPATLGTHALKKIYDLLKNKTVYWRKMSEAEQVEAEEDYTTQLMKGAVTPKERKERSDKGQAR